MFVRKSTYEARVKELEFIMETVRLGHLAEVNALRDQIKDLRQLVFPPTPKAIDPITLEVDSVLNGSDKPIEISEKEHNALMERAREMDLIFSGNYSEDLLQ